MCVCYYVYPQEFTIHFGITVQWIPHPVIGDKLKNEFDRKWCSMEPMQMTISVYPAVKMSGDIVVIEAWNESLWYFSKFCWKNSWFFTSTMNVHMIIKILGLEIQGIILWDCVVKIVEDTHPKSAPPKKKKNENIEVGWVNVKGQLKPSATEIATYYLLTHPLPPSFNWYTDQCNKKHINFRIRNDRWGI